MKTLLHAVLADEEGATLVEYALIVSLVAVACIAVIETLSSKIQTSFNSIGNAVSSA